MSDPFILNLMPLQAKLDASNALDPRNTISPSQGGYPTVTAGNIGTESNSILSSPEFYPAVIGLITAFI